MSEGPHRSGRNRRVSADSCQHDAEKPCGLATHYANWRGRSLDYCDAQISCCGAIFTEEPPWQEDSLCHVATSGP